MILFNTSSYGENLSLSGVLNLFFIIFQKCIDFIIFQTIDLLLPLFGYFQFSYLLEIEGKQCWQTLLDIISASFEQMKNNFNKILNCVTFNKIDRFRYRLPSSEFWKRYWIQNVWMVWRVSIQWSKEKPPVSCA